MPKLLDGKTNTWWQNKAKKWTAGSSVNEAVRCVKKYNKKGYRVIINSIADVSHDQKALELIRDKYIELIEAIKKNRLNASITVRTSNLGIGYSYQEAKNALEAVLKKAKASQLRVEVDMEEREFAKKTLKAVTELAKKGYRFRVCIQSAVKDIDRQVARLRKANKNLSFRIVTGSCYKETMELDEPKTIKQFYKLIFLAGKETAIGTHITERILCAKANGIESQVLMGFESKQPKGSVDTIYACFGDWKTNAGIRGYIQRREKPA